MALLYLPMKKPPVPERSALPSLAIRCTATMAAFGALSLGSAHLAADMLVSPGPGQGGEPVALLGRPLEDDRAVLVALGELAFKSKEVLGVEFSCDDCHPDGGTTSTIFFTGLSDKPGNIDTTNRALTMVEDGRFNPKNIPSLRGAAHTEPFGHRGNFETLRPFTLFAVTGEFNGPTPTDLILDALVAYQEEVAFPDNPALDARGRLTDAASDAAVRGQTLFAKPFSDNPALSCATCHPPDANFTDGAVHDIGSGDVFDAPSLRDVVASPPYFHDGRHDTLADVVDHFDRQYGLGLASSDKDDLVAYLEAIGGGTAPPPVPRPDVNGRRFPANIEPLLAMAIAGKDHSLGDLIVEQAVRELDIWRTAADAPDGIAAWKTALRRIEPLMATGKWAAADEAVRSDLNFVR